MAKRPAVDTWLAARQQWEADPTQSHDDIAKVVGVSRAAVSKRADKEGWTRPQDLRAIVEKAHLQADAKVAPGLEAKRSAADVTGKTTEQAAIDVRSAVIEQHRRDWAEHRELFPLSAIEQDFDNGKKAKISAEMTMLRQKGERMAYGIADEDEGSNKGTVTVVIKRFSDA